MGLLINHAENNAESNKDGSADRDILTGTSINLHPFILLH